MFICYSSLEVYIILLFYQLIIIFSINLIVIINYLIIIVIIIDIIIDIIDIIVINAILIINSKLKSDFSIDGRIINFLNQLSIIKTKLSFMLIPKHHLITQLNNNNSQLCNNFIIDNIINILLYKIWINSTNITSSHIC
jgi:RNase P/RNase MRP subunit p29